MANSSWIDKPRWKQIADWRREHRGVSGGKNAKRRQGRGIAARHEYGVNVSGE